MSYPQNTSNPPNAAYPPPPNTSQPGSVAYSSEPSNPGNQSYPTDASHPANTTHPTNAASPANPSYPQNQYYPPPPNAPHQPDVSHSQNPSFPQHESYPPPPNTSQTAAYNPASYQHPMQQPGLSQPPIDHQAAGTVHQGTDMPPKKQSAWDKTRHGGKATFDKVWAGFEKLGAPVNKLTNKIGSEAFWPTGLGPESDKAARILKSFCSSSSPFLYKKTRH